MINRHSNMNLWREDAAGGEGPHRAPVHHGLSVNDDMRDPGGMTVGIGVGRLVLHSRRIEEGQVGRVALPDQATVFEAQLGRRHPGHLVDRRLPREQFLLPCIMLFEFWTSLVVLPLQYSCLENPMGGGVW